MGKGKKQSRKIAGSNLKYSVIVDDATNKRFTLLAGKERPGAEATHKGKGEFGSVKLAKNDQGEIVAVKVIVLINPPAGQLSEEQLKEIKAAQEKQLNDLKKELEDLKFLGYPVDLVLTDKKAYLFQPYFPGEPIKNVFARNLARLDKRDLSKDLEAQKKQILNNMDVVVKHMQYTISFLKAVKELHDKKMLHCDLHAGNALYDAKTAKTNLIDFGLAQRLSTGHDMVILPGEHPLFAEHLPKEVRGLDKTNDHIYSKSSDFYALGYDAFVQPAFMDELSGLTKESEDKSMPWTVDFDKVINDIDQYVMNFITNVDESERGKNNNTKSAIEVIHKRKPAEQILKFMEEKLAQLNKERNKFGIYSADMSKDLLKKADPVAQKKLKDELQQRKLWFSQIFKDIKKSPVLKPTVKAPSGTMVIKPEVAKKLVISQFKYESRSRKGSGKDNVNASKGLGVTATGKPMIPQSRTAPLADIKEKSEYEGKEKMQKAITLPSTPVNYSSIANTPSNSSNSSANSSNRATPIPSDGHATPPPSTTPTPSARPPEPFLPSTRPSSAPSSADKNTVNPDRAPDSPASDTSDKSNKSKFNSKK